MKRTFIFSMTIAVFAFVFSSCQPYEDGPSFSLLSKTSRITGEWTMTENLHNGIAQNISESDPEFEFVKDGTGFASVYFLNIRIQFKLEWEFANNGETLKMRVQDEDQEWDEWTEYTILKLYKKEMAIERTYFNDDYQVNVTEKVSFTKK